MSIPVFVDLDFEKIFKDIADKCPLKQATKDATPETPAAVSQAPSAGTDRDIAIAKPANVKRRNAPPTS